MQMKNKFSCQLNPQYSSCKATTTTILSLPYLKFLFVLMKTRVKKLLGWQLKQIIVSIYIWQNTIYKTLSAKYQETKI